MAEPKPKPKGGGTMRKMTPKAGTMKPWKEGGLKVKPKPGTTGVTHTQIRGYVGEKAGTKQGVSAAHAAWSRSAMHKLTNPSTGGPKAGSMKKTGAMIKAIGFTNKGTTALKRKLSSGRVKGY